MVSTKDNDSKRIYEIDFVKVTCCILVIVIHSACDFLPKPLMNLLRCFNGCGGTGVYDDQRVFIVFYIGKGI